MATEIVIETEDRPGVLAEIGELFGESGINIQAAAAFTHTGRGILHFVVDDADLAVKVLADAGHHPSQVREVLAVSLDDRPGELGRYARMLAQASVNIASLYTGGSTDGEQEVIIAVDNIERVRQI